MQSLWMLAASFFFAIMGMFIKLSSSYHNLGEIVLFRGLPSASRGRVSTIVLHLQVHAPDVHRLLQRGTRVLTERRAIHRIT